MAGNLTCDVFVNDPPPQDGSLPNGEPKRFGARVVASADTIMRMRGSAAGRPLLRDKLYGVREHPETNGRQIILASWL